MSVFTVVISKPTRRGSEPLITRHVESMGNSYDVQKYFNTLYSGFIVTVTTVQNIDTINIPVIVKEERKVAETRIEVIKGKNIKLTEEEEELYKEYKAKFEICRAAKRALRSSVKKRLEQLPWIKEIDMDDIKIDSYSQECIEIEKIWLKDRIISYFEEIVSNEAQDE